MEIFQRFFDRFRSCECPELSGDECNCVSEDVKEDLVFVQHRSTQTEEMNGKFAIKNIYIIYNAKRKEFSLRRACKLFESSPVCDW